MILPFNDDTPHKLLISKVYMFNYINKVFLKYYFLLSPQGVYKTVFGICRIFGP